MLPFTRHLKEYVRKGNHSLCVPGHQQRIPELELENSHFGEEILKTDVDIAVAGFGSLQSHSFVIGESEEYASKTFGSARTYYVLNGTSTSNKMVIQGVCTKGDKVVLDRNSHRSIIQGFMYVPVKEITYLMPMRNRDNILGPIPFSAIADIPAERQFLALTQCTYDGLVYNAEKILEIASKKRIRNVLLDEAWIAYAKWHPLFARLCDGMSATKGQSLDLTNVWSTQSTHKTLTALSQGSMVHLRPSLQDPDIARRFNTAFEAGTTTSPFFPLISSLEIATYEMDRRGEERMRSALENVFNFRQKMASSQLFRVFQPENLGEMPIEKLFERNTWLLKEDDPWHGFSGVGNDFVILDPFKINVFLDSPGMCIPGTLAAEHLLKKSKICTDKVGFFSIFFMCTITFTKDMATNLFNAFTLLSDDYKQNTDGFRDRCVEKEQSFRNMQTLERNLANNKPEVVVSPYESTVQLVKGNVDLVVGHAAIGRVSACLLVPYPPGIPLIMPGERLSEQHVHLALTYIQHGCDVQGMHAVDNMKAFLVLKSA